MMWVGSICMISYEVSQSSLSGPSETYSNIPITACLHKCFRVVVRPKYSKYRNGNANVNCSMAGELPMYQFPILSCQVYPRAFASISISSMPESLCLPHVLLVFTIRPLRP